LMILKDIQWKRITMKWTGCGCPAFKTLQEIVVCVSSVIPLLATSLSDNLMHFSPSMSGSRDGVADLNLCDGSQAEHKAVEFTLESGRLGRQVNLGHSTIGWILSLIVGPIGPFFMPLFVHGASRGEASIGPRQIARRFANFYKNIWMSRGACEQDTLLCTFLLFVCLCRYPRLLYVVPLATTKDKIRLQFSCRMGITGLRLKRALRTSGWLMSTYSCSLSEG